MANRNHDKKVKTNKEVFDTLNDLQKKAVFYLAGLIEELSEVEKIEDFVKNHYDDSFLSVRDVILTLNEDQAKSVDYILRCCMSAREKDLKGESDGVHEA